MFESKLKNDSDNVNLNLINVGSEAWFLLDTKDKKLAKFLFLVLIISGMSTVIMVGSIYPFLTVLSDPEQIHKIKILSDIYNFGLFETKFQFLVFLGIASMVIIALSNLIQMARIWLASNFALMQVNNLSTKLFNKYLNKQYEFYLQQDPNKLTTQILSETQEAVNRFYKPITELISSTINTFLIFTGLILVNAKVAIISISTIAIIYGFIRILTRKIISDSGKTRSKVNNLRFSIVENAFLGIKTIKQSNAEAFYKHEFERPSFAMSKILVKIQIFSQLPQYIIQIFGFCGVILLCLIMTNPSDFYDKKTVSEIFPLLGVFVFAGQRLLPEIAKIYQSLTMIGSGVTVVSSIYNAVTEETYTNQQTGRRLPFHFSKKIEMQNVSYVFPNSDKKVLSAIDVSISAGERVGIVGPSGSGKTTFVELLMGLLSPTSGKVTIDSVELSAENLMQWRENVSYVPQEVFIEAGTITTNIAFGEKKSEINIDKVINSIKIANLTENYGEKINEEVRLSGGQKQRLGVARALYKNSSLIVFDEITSALDNLTENNLLRDLEVYTKDKTVVTIAHRLHTLKTCDRIIVFENGKIENIGSWNYLAKNSRLFRELLKNDRSDGNR